MKTIIYCNFEELASKIKVNEFPSQNSDFINSKWLKIFYYLFLENQIINVLSNDITNDQLEYFKTELSTDKKSANEILSKNKFYFIENFEVLINTLITQKKIELIDDKYFKIYCIDGNYFVQQFSTGLNRQNSAIAFSCIIKSLIDNDHINLSESNKIIYICHDKHIDGPKQADYLFTNKKKKDFEEKVKATLNGFIENIGNLHIEEIISFQHVNYSETLKSFNKDNFTIDHDSLILKLKEEQKKNELIELKKQIINLWLPLAIDIQGLSEVKNDKTKYYDEIKKELLDQGKETEYYTSLKLFPKGDEFPRWEEIKSEIKNGYKKFNPSDLVKAIIKTDYSQFKDNPKNYLLKKNVNEEKENPNFLPNWLQEVVRILDDKINPPDDKK